MNKAQFMLGWVAVSSIVFGTLASSSWAAGTTILRVTNPRNNSLFVIENATKIFSIPTGKTFSFIYSGEPRSFAYASGKAGSLSYNYTEGFSVVAATCLAEKIKKQNSDDQSLFTCDLRFDEDPAHTNWRGAAYKMTVTGIQSYKIPRENYNRFYSQFKAGNARIDRHEHDMMLKSVREAARQTGALAQWERDLEIMVNLNREHNDQVQKVLVFGDQGDPGAELTGKSMYSTCVLTGCDYGISAGDNIYKSGPKISSAKWEDDFTLKFVQPFFSIWDRFRVPFFLALGNHDVGIEDFWQGDWNFAWREKYGKSHYDTERRPRMEAQVQFSSSGANPKDYGEHRMWNMPSESYTQVIEKNGVKTFLVVLDTNYYPGQLQGHDTPYNTNQAEWLTEQLHSQDARNSDWQIVVAHHPIYSVGRHGVNVGKYIGKNDVESMNRLRELLQPVLCEAGVDFYLVGHDHHLQVDSIPCQNRSLIQVLSGAASKADVAKWHERTMRGGDAFSPELVQGADTFLWANGLTKEEITRVKDRKGVEALKGFSFLKLGKTVAELQMIKSLETGPQLLECWTLDRTRASSVSAQFIHPGCQLQLNWTPLFVPVAAIAN